MGEKRSIQFKKDWKRVTKQGHDMGEVRALMRSIAEGEPLDPKHKAHSLHGHSRKIIECHVKPNLLLTYKQTGKDIVFERLGSHPEIFG